jgi:hypothetical protein
MFKVARCILEAAFGDGIQDVEDRPVRSCSSDLSSSTSSCPPRVALA